MIGNDAKRLKYDNYTFKGQPVIFTDCRIDSESVPKGMHLYEIRHSDEGAVPCQLARGIWVNFWGSLLTNDPIQLHVDGLLDFEEDELSYVYGDSVGIYDYLAAHPSEGKDVMTFYIAEEKDHEFMFSNGESFDNAMNVVGHLRGDFGSGKQFYTTWWPHNEDKLNMPEFKADINRVVNWLRGDSCPQTPLRDLETMQRFCRAREDVAKIKSEQMESYGFTIDTKRYHYALRCIPIEKNYNFYLYAYKKGDING